MSSTEAVLPMCDFVRVIDLKDIPADQAAPVQIGDRWFAVCQYRGTVYLTDILCPHAGGPLGCAEVHDGGLICPVHYWFWDLKTGVTHVPLSHLHLNRYRCEVRDGTVYADVSAPIPADSHVSLEEMEGLGSA